MPGRDFQNRRDSPVARRAERKQTIARPTVKHVVAPGRQLPGCNPVEIFLFRSVVIRAIERRKQADRVPAERMNSRRGNLRLAIIVGDRFAEEAAVVGGA